LPRISGNVVWPAHEFIEEYFDVRGGRREVDFENASLNAAATRSTRPRLDDGTP
jgi:hypothetical protein